ncbi:MAG: hypothetical protein AB1705_16045 [Verrucomicrobiota bacterium]
MKTLLILCLVLALADYQEVRGQDDAQAVPKRAPIPRAPRSPDSPKPPPAPPPPDAASRPIRFDIDFPGGPPALLVEMIVKITREPLNVIIPEKSANAQLPPLRMSLVTVPQLFEALRLASQGTETQVTGTFTDPSGKVRSQWQQAQVECGFKLAEPARAGDAPIYYFYEKRPMTIPDQLSKPSCRFYQLAPHLERGYSVEDITTAIQTAWDLLGGGEKPQLKFHQDTALLIAVGPEDKLNLIDLALRELQGAQKKGATSAPAAGQPKPPKP